MSRSVFVAGGDPAIGHAIARSFIDAGDQVAVGFPRDGAPEGALVVPLDVADPDSIEAALAVVEANHGTVEVLVVGTELPRDEPTQLDAGAFDPVVDANLRNAVGLVRSVVGEMKSGRIVVLSSVGGVRGAACRSHYAAAHGGLVGFTRSIARELGSRFTANVLALGFVETKAADDDIALHGALYIGDIPLQRTATLEEVGGMARFLASDDAAYVTGAVIPLDGGYGIGY
ncbi:SDR family oxidoreductase [Streptomyces luteireticuli]|uniref:3-oxoacyl-[acyl-carrier-protein] reductase n=1 Tax=Streptomyces luteireticuli TaxID=173858 RepID=A0ABN0YZT9_9ACTN